MSDLVGVKPELIGSVSFGDLRAYGLGYAVDPDSEGAIYLSMVGYRTAEHEESLDRNLPGLPRFIAYDGDSGG